MLTFNCDDLLIQKSILAKPHPPGIPNIANVGRNFVDLTWDKPLKDGGSKITGKCVTSLRKILSTDFKYRKYYT